jgi:hypothetical protein
LDEEDGSYAVVAFFEFEYAQTIICGPTRRCLEAEEECITYSDNFLGNWLLLFSELEHASA